MASAATNAVSCGNLWKKPLPFCIIPARRSTAPGTGDAPLQKTDTDMDYDPRSEPHNLSHDPTTSLVVPRPIGWISTISPSGVGNLAPHRYFHFFVRAPPPTVF